MGEHPHPGQPLLIVVTGRPGAGKTTLAHALSREIRCPLISRDEIKEGWVNTVGSSGGEESRANVRANEAFFGVVGYLLDKGITHVAEAAFQHKLWAPRLEPLSKVARTRLIVCSIDPGLARARFIERGLADGERGRYHADHDVRAAEEGVELPVGHYEPPDLPVPTLAVDTADGYHPAFDEIVSFVRG